MAEELVKLEHAGGSETICVHDAHVSWGRKSRSRWTYCEVSTIKHRMVLSTFGCLSAVRPVPVVAPTPQIAETVSRPPSANTRSDHVPDGPLLETPQHIFSLYST